MALTFSQNVNPATAADVRVFSGQAGGRRAGAASASGNVVTFNPTADFRPGEKVSVSVPSTVLGTGGEVAVPHVYQFLAASSGGGGFGPPATVAVGTRVVGMALAEVNGDGDLDLLTVSNNNAGTVRIQFGNGSGGFGSPQTLSVENSPSDMAMGDVDGDGDLDFVTGNTGSSNSVSLGLNTGAACSARPIGGRGQGSQRRGPGRRGRRRRPGPGGGQAPGQCHRHQPERWQRHLRRDE